MSKIFIFLWQIRFIDNTDPAGIDHQIAQLGPDLASTLVIVISKVCIEMILFVILVVSDCLLGNIANLVHFQSYLEWRHS